MTLKIWAHTLELTFCLSNIELDNKCICCSLFKTIVELDRCQECSPVATGPRVLPLRANFTKHSWSAAFVGSNECPLLTACNINSSLSVKKTRQNKIIKIKKNDFANNFYRKQNFSDLIWTVSKLFVLIIAVATIKCIFNWKFHNFLMHFIKAKSAQLQFA